MSRKPVIPRGQARTDIDEATDYYLNNVSEKIALAFIDELERAYSAIAESPGIGSPRYAHELDLAGLRSKLLNQFPYLVFYIEREDHIDVWRILHAERDIPAWMVPVSGE
jgi:toxin ParE1/3/4